MPVSSLWYCPSEPTTKRTNTSTIIPSDSAPIGSCTFARTTICWARATHRSCPTCRHVRPLYERSTLLAAYRMALSRDSASGDGDRLYLDLPGWVGEATDDQRVRWPAFAERFLSSRATGCDVGGIRQDGYELHDVIERHTRSAQLSIEIGPDEAALLLDVAGDVPLGVD